MNAMDGEGRSERDVAIVRWLFGRPVCPVRLSTRSGRSCADTCGVFCVTTMRRVCFTMRHAAYKRTVGSITPGVCVHEHCRLTTLTKWCVDGTFDGERGVD